MNNQSIVIVSSVLTAILSISFLILLHLYIKQKRKVFSTKKIVVYSAFLAIFLIQNIVLLPISHLPLIPWSLESVTIIAIGFIFGPLEAIVYGIIADLLGALISGYIPLPIYMLNYPITGLIAGLSAMYYKKENKSIFFSQIIFHIGLLSFVIVPIIIANTNSAAIINARVPELLIYISALVSFLSFEMINLFLIKRKNTNYIHLFSILTFGIVLNRIIVGWTVMPSADAFYYGIPYELAMFSRIITSSYLVPSTVVVSLCVISASYYGMKVTNF